MDSGTGATVVGAATVVSLSLMSVLHVGLAVLAVLILVFLLRGVLTKAVSWTSGLFKEVNEEAKRLAAEDQTK